MDDDLLEVVRETAHGYDVFGELGREGEDDIWFLARKTGSPALVALRLRRLDEGSDPGYSLEVARELSERVSMEQGTCSVCHARLRSFATFCSRCGADQTGDGNAATGSTDAAQRLAGVREAASSRYEVLGEMPWSGAGSIYFALEKSTSRLVRLRLRDAGKGFELTETQVGMTLAGAVTATYTTAPTSRGGPPSIRQRPPAPPAAATAPPEPPPAQPPPRHGKLIYLTIGLGVLVVVLIVLVVLLLIRR